MKNKILLFISGCFTLLFASCLGSDDTSSVLIPRDAQISSFSLSNDSVPGLNSLKFTIDQLNGVIFNKDSMAYGTQVEKVLCTIRFRSSAMSARITAEAYPDSTFAWNENDSIDFSKPVKMMITALDGVTTKTYTAKVNIHQVHPDSMQWSLYAANPIPETIREQKTLVYPYNDTDAYFMYIKTDNAYKLYYSSLSELADWNVLPLSGLDRDDMLVSQVTSFDGYLYMPSESGVLYRSTDGLDWSAVNHSLSVKTLLGALPEGRGQLPLLATLVEQDGLLYFAYMNNQLEWTIGEEVHDKFPVANFTNVQYENMYYNYLMIATGKDKSNQLTNTVWATMNGLDWALLTGEDNSLAKKEGAMLARYDEKFFLIGGINAEGKASKEIHISKDNGITWALQDSLVAFPDDYKARGFSSVQVDADNYMLIFGGKTSKDSESLNEIWRGRINRLGF